MAIILLCQYCQEITESIQIELRFSLRIFYTAFQKYFTNYSDFGRKLKFVFFYRQKKWADNVF